MRSVLIRSAFTLATLKEPSVLLTHAERDEIHGAATHATGKERLDLLVEVRGRNPISQPPLNSLGGLGNGRDPLRRRDERARFDTSDVLRVSPRQKAIVVFRQRDEDPGIDELKT